MVILERGLLSTECKSTFCFSGLIESNRQVSPSINKYGSVFIASRLKWLERVRQVKSFLIFDTGLVRRPVGGC
jgi:hypothetical protein